VRTLDAIAIEHGTDKASLLGKNASRYAARGPHDYARHYDLMFGPRRHEVVKLLEIGVGDGPSIRLWLEYFESGQIFGVDYEENTSPWTRSESPHPRYTFVHGDQGDKNFWNQFLEQHGNRWDIIIDDGSHVNEHVIGTFEKLWDTVTPGGFYCIEDIGVIYATPYTHVKAGTPSQHELLSRLIDKLNRGTESNPESTNIDAIHLAHQLAILVKAPSDVLWNDA